MSRVDRRRFLRGLGTAIALPAFGSLRAVAAPAENSLATTATGAPLRMAFMAVPNGTIPSAWHPKGEGKDFEWSRTLAPLAKHKDYVQVLGGLDNVSAEPGPDGAGDHARGTGTLLTGVRLKKSSSDIRAGISIDQVLAREFAGLTRFPSLELTCDASPKSGGCDSGYACAYQFNLSWSSPTSPKTAEANPRAVFERLFGAGNHGERTANLARRQQEEKSILDFVLDDARSMAKRLDARDKSKLDQYLTSVREIETRIHQAEKFGNVPDPKRETPAGIPADYAEHLALHFDMLTLAFQTDATRIATLLFAHDGSNRSFDHIGISEGHHDLTHHMNKKDWIEKVADIDLWYVQQFSRFLEKMRAVEDVDGKPMLHNTMVIYGSGNADGNRHTHVDLPIVLAGAGGSALTPGRHVKCGSKPLTNLYLKMAHIAGVTKLERFGDSTAPLQGV